MLGSPASHLRALAGFAADSSLSGLPRPVVDNARKRIADFLAIAVRGIGSHGPRELLANTTMGGPCNVLGVGWRASAADAAWINSAAGHVFGLDDFHPLSAVHPGVVVIPAVLAYAQALDGTVEQLLPALAVGYEVATRVGAVFPAGRLHANGFHPTTVCGLLGATAGCMRLQGAGESQLLSGLRLATSFVGGLARFSGSSAVKALEVGQAARLGVDLARLACAGVAGPREALDFETGFFAILGHGGAISPERLSNGLGSEWGLLTTSFKPWAQGTSSHRAVTAALEALRSSGLTPDAISQVRIEVPESELNRLPDAASTVTRVSSSRAAQQDPAHCVAVSLLAAQADSGPFDPLVDWYEDLERLNAPDVLALRSKVTWCRPRPGDRSVTAHLVSRNGQSVAASAATFPGDSLADTEQLGLSWEHLEGRGKALAGPDGAWWPLCLSAVRAARPDLSVSALVALAVSAQS